MGELALVEYDRESRWEQLMYIFLWKILPKYIKKLKQTHV